VVVEHARHFRKPQLPGGEHATMPGDDIVLRVNQDRIHPSELPNARGDLRNLRLTMRSGVFRVWNKFIY